MGLDLTSTLSQRGSAAETAVGCWRRAADMGRRGQAWTHHRGGSTKTERDTGESGGKATNSAAARAPRARLLRPDPSVIGAEAAAQCGADCRWERSPRSPLEGNSRARRAAYERYYIGKGWP